MSELKVFNEEVIPVYITDKGEKVVYGRELQEKLKLTKDYTNWMKDMIAYGFNEGTDYQEFWEKESVAQMGDAQLSTITNKSYFKSSQQASALGYYKNHLLKVDMAKHIAMVQRTTEGMAVRQKLIDLEKQTPACIEDVLIQSLQEMKSIRLAVNKQQEEISKLEENQKAITSTFAKENHGDFRTWVNHCLSVIAESPNYQYIGNREEKHMAVRAESYERLCQKKPCRLDQRVEAEKGRAFSAGASQTRIKAINKLTIIEADKALKPVYETVIKEMMLAYCVEA